MNVLLHDTDQYGPVLLGCSFLSFTQARSLSKGPWSRLLLLVKAACVACMGVVGSFVGTSPFSCWGGVFFLIGPFDS